MGKPFRNASVEFMKVTPSLPQRGRQHAGASPLDPLITAKNFSHGFPSTAMLHGASPDEAASARGPIAIESRRGVRIFYRAEIFTFPVILKKKPSANQQENVLLQKKVMRRGTTAPQPALRRAGRNGAARSTTGCRCPAAPWSICRKVSPFLIRQP